MTDTTIVLAGATGDLGDRIARALLDRGCKVRALVRYSTSPTKIARLEKLGAAIATVDPKSTTEMTQACEGASCVVSALSGLRDVIVDAQTALLEATIKAGVPRFIPSDYSIDFTKLGDGTNRNLDLRRVFYDRVNKTSVAATSILNGAFAELLTGDMPLIIFRWRVVLYWGDADQRMDFTTKDNVAEFTAAAAMDPSSTPRILRIAGDQISPRELAKVASGVTGEKYRLVRAGSLGMLGAMIKIARALAPKSDELYPAWQGMQYMHNMVSGLPKFQSVDNDRYPEVRWTTARDVLAAHVGSRSR